MPITVTNKTKQEIDVKLYLQIIYKNSAGFVVVIKEIYLVFCSGSGWAAIHSRALWIAGGIGGGVGK